MNMEEILQQTKLAAIDLFESAVLRAGDIVVLGCSTSAVGGYELGTNSSQQVAQTVFDALLPFIKERSCYLAVQCCEHLNRALVMERECMDRYGFTEVCVSPWLHAGGAASVEAMQRLNDPVVVEDIRHMASAGMDIGGTLIGMHLKSVAVPIHTPHHQIGQAYVIMARTRPKYIGGSRARYPQ